MGLSDNNVARYCVSVDDGQDDPADGERSHPANTLFLTGYAGPDPEDIDIAPTNITLHNNLIVSTNRSTQYFRRRLACLDSIASCSPLMLHPLLPHHKMKK